MTHVGITITLVRGNGRILFQKAELIAVMNKVSLWSQF